MGHRHFALEFPEDRNLKHEPIPEDLAPVRLLKPPEQIDEDAGAHDHINDVVFREIAQIHKELGRRRKGRVHAFEHLGENRDDEVKHEDQDHDENNENDAREHHGPLDPCSEFGRFFYVGGQALEDDIQDTALFTGRDQIAVEVVKGFGVLLQALGQGRAGGYIGIDFLNHSFESRIVLLSA